MTDPAAGKPAALAEAVLAFWFGNDGDLDRVQRRDIWFEKNPDFDAEISTRFQEAHRRAATGELDAMAQTARGALALVILLDQFPRNMYRGDRRAFAADGKALATTRSAIAAGHDMAVPPVARSFFYLPFEHAEDIAVQRAGIPLFERLSRHPECAESLKYAQRHLEIVERFGRFPHRNPAMGRETTPEEAAFLEEPNSSF